MSAKQKGAEVALRAQLVEAQDKIERLEFDRTALQARLREQQEAASKEAKKLREQIEESKAKHAKPPESEKMLEALTQALLKVYIEIKDRKALAESDEMLAENRALARVHPMVIVSYLRSHVRNLLTSHEDCEFDLRVQLRLHEDEANKNVRNLKERMAAVQSTQTRAIAMAEEAQMKLEDAEHAKDAALEDTRGLIEQVKADQMTLVLQMRGQGEENEKLQKVIAEKDKQLKRQETKMLQMASLESEIQSLRAENLLSNKKTQAQHEAKTAQFQNDIKRLVKLEAENARFTERVRQLEAELKDCKTSYTVMHYMDAQAKSARLESLYRAKTKAYEEMEVRLKSLEKAADHFKEEKVQMERKYNKLLDAVEAENLHKQKNEGPGGGGVADVRKKAEDLSVVYYKDLVREKDKEIQTLIKRIKRLSAGDLRYRLNLRHSEQDRQELSDRIASLSYQLDRTMVSQKELRSTADAHDAMTRALPQHHVAVAGEGDGEGARSDDEEAALCDLISGDEDLDDGDDGALDWEVHFDERQRGRGVRGGGGGGGESRSLDAARAHSVPSVPGGLSRPQSALSAAAEARSSGSGLAVRRSWQSGKEKVSIAIDSSSLGLETTSISRPQSTKSKEMAFARDDLYSKQDPAVEALQSKMLAAGGRLQLGPREVGRIKELEDENVRMATQLNMLKNVMAVSQGAADAYLAVVAKLQGHEMSDGTGTGARATPLPHDTERMLAAEEQAGEEGASKLAKAKRGQITQAREVEVNAAYRPPRPTSAPPGRQPLPLSRPSSATPASAAAKTLGAGIAGVGIHGRSRGMPPRPSSAMHRGPNSRPGSALSRD